MARQISQPAAHRPSNAESFLHPLLFSIPNTAIKLSMSRRTVERLISAGELEAVGNGKLRRVTYTSILSYIERHRVEVV
ncbi:MAG: helix-turn-helix domain-containing protein [Chloroflexales bacterium]|nr:helix-turn-helix domain-containing protein [Chloroflexales bacterium]